MRNHLSIPLGDDAIFHYRTKGIMVFFYLNTISLRNTGQLVENLVPIRTAWVVPRPSFSYNSLTMNKHWYQNTISLAIPRGYRSRPRR